MLRIRLWPGVANFFRKLQARGVPQPVLLNHFLKLTAEHIHLASGVIPHEGSAIGLNRVAPESDVKPVAPGAYRPLCAITSSIRFHVRVWPTSPRARDGFAYSSSCMHISLPLMSFYESRRNREGC